MINYTNESIAEETTTNTLDWLKTLNDEGMDMNPIVYFFDEQDIPYMLSLLLFLIYHLNYS